MFQLLQRYETNGHSELAWPVVHFQPHHAHPHQSSPGRSHPWSALSLVSGCQSLQDLIGGTPKPTAHVIGASIRGLSLENIVLLFDIEVENPYATSLPLIDLGYSLASGGRKFLEGTVKPTGSIPARGKQVIQLPATIPFAPLLATLKGVKPGAIVPYTADFKLGVDAPVLGRLDVPLSKSGELPIPAVPQVELSSLAIGKLSLDQMTASAKLQVKNTNQFPLDLTKARRELGAWRAGGRQQQAGTIRSTFPQDRQRHWMCR